MVTPQTLFELLNSTKKMNDPFFKTYENQLPKDFCEHLISKFEQSPLKHPGLVFSSSIGKEKGSLDLELKKSTDLCISHHPNFEPEDTFLKYNLDVVMEDYFLKLVGNDPPYFTTLTDTGFQVQKTKPGEMFNWHSDDNNCLSELRRLAYIWYLNDVEEGGETEFITGVKITPETGKCIVFPATWTYKHRGMTPVSNTKYICTGFIIQNVARVK